jgi:predicted unusual protein kinase regulating ubiquinone biosynthesis (AarF/ABC1/UbiB family)
MLLNLSRPKTLEPGKTSYEEFALTLVHVLYGQHLWQRTKAFFGLTPNLRQEAATLESRLNAHLMSPLLANPEASRKMVAEWQAELVANTEPGLFQDTQRMFLTYLGKNLDNPVKLKRAAQLTALVMVNGGYEKYQTLSKLWKDPAFQAASMTKKGQYALEALGPLYVKAFQTISTVPELFSAETQRSLVQLYEDLTPVPFSDLRAMVEEELGGSLPQLFDEFSQEPLKVGSIAQVHQASYLGQPVAVKIVKPGVRESIHKDAEMFLPMVELVAEIVDQFNVKEMYQGFMERLANEALMSKHLISDPDGEAEHLKAMGEAYKVISDARVPKVYDRRTSRNVLTMEFVPGRSLLGYKGNPVVAQKYLKLYLSQVFVAGHVQEDPHPGNTLYDPKTEKFSCIDAGLSKAISLQERIDTAKLMIAIVSRNPDMLAAAVVADGMSAHPAYPVFKEKLATLFQEEMTAPNGQVGQDKLTYKQTVKLLSKIAKLAMEEGLSVKEPNPMLWKSIFTGVSVARTLDPNVNIALPVVTVLGHLFLQNQGVSYMVSSATTVAGDYLGEAWKGARSTLETTGQSLYQQWFGKKKPKEEPPKADDPPPPAQEDPDKETSS